MRIAIRHKFVLILLLSVAFSLTLSGIFLHLFLADLHGHYARKEIAEAFRIVKNDISSIEADLTERMRELRTQENLIAGLNLISDYQPTFDYLPILFDEEKKQIIQMLHGFLRLSHIDRISVYDARHRLVGFVLKNDPDPFLGGIVSQKEGEPFILLSADEENWASGDLPEIMESTDLKEIPDKTGPTYRHEKGRIYMQIFSPVIRSLPDGTAKKVGAIRFIHKIGRKYMAELSDKIRMKIRFIPPTGSGFGTLEEIPVGPGTWESTCIFKGNLTENTKVGWYESRDYFFHVCCMTMADRQKVFIVLGSEKALLRTAIHRTTLILTGVLFLSGILVTLTGFLAARQIVTQPVEKLVKAVRAFEKGESESIRPEKMNARDEFGILSGAFHDMMRTIRNREAEIGRHRDHLEEMVRKRTAALHMEVMERRQAEKELKTAKEAAEAAAKAKSEFLAVMSHEIRTPMNAIIGLTDHLLTDGLSSEQHGHMAVVKSSAEHLLLLINDILDLSKIEAGKIRLEAVPFDLREHLSEVTAPLFTGAGEKEIDTLLAVDREVPNRIMGDPGRLRQVIYNLISNAVKFTEAGSIRVNVWTESADEEDTDEEEPKDIFFSVSDTGIGIAPEKLQEIFSPFTQADASTSRRFGGTGLGLSISRQLVEMMGGTLKVESDPGRGSCFTLAVPFEVLPAEAAEDVRPAPEGTPAPPLQGEEEGGIVRVLLVEDNPFNQRVAQILLEKLPCAVEIADTGEKALAILEEKTFDIVLMDIQMPGMDGYETTRVIRGKEWGNSVPIIAMTAHAMKGDREQCIAAGMDDYIPKPIRLPDLEAVIRRNLIRRNLDGKWPPPGNGEMGPHGPETRESKEV